MEPIDLYLTANLLIQQHGTAAKAHAAKRLQELQGAGDEEGAWVWMGVIDAIVVLEAEPMEGQPVH